MLTTILRWYILCIPYPKAPVFIKLAVPTFGSSHGHQWTWTQFSLCKIYILLLWAYLRFTWTHLSLCEIYIVVCELKFLKIILKSARCLFSYESWIDLYVLTRTLSAAHRPQFNNMWILRYKPGQTPRCCKLTIANFSETFISFM